MKHPARPTGGRLMSQYGYTAPASPASRLPQQSPLWLVKHPARPTAAHIIFRYGRSPQPHVAPSTLRRARLSEEPWTAHSQKAILQTTRPSATTKWPPTPHYKAYLYKTTRMCGATLPADDAKPSTHKDPHDRVPSTASP